MTLRNTEWGESPATGSPRLAVLGRALVLGAVRILVTWARPTIVVYVGSGQVKVREAVSGPAFRWLMWQLPCVGVLACWHASWLG